MLKNFILLIILLVLIIGGYYVYKSYTQTGSLDLNNLPLDLTGEDTILDESVVSFNAPLEPVVSSSLQQEGFATLERQGDKVQVTVNVTGGSSGNVQPVHLHEDGCPGKGKVLYPLNDIHNGKSETVLDVSLDELKEKLPLAINVHKSKEESSVYTACGEVLIPF